MSEEEVKLRDDDPDNPKRAIASLQRRVPASLIRGKIVEVPAETTKFLCPNHPMRTVIELIESPQRMRHNKLNEFECSCGTIYKKKKK